MSEQVVTIAEVQRRARAAFIRVLPLEDCPLPWHSAARATWEAEYAILQAQSQRSHAAPVGRQHLDAHQGVEV